MADLEGLYRRHIGAAMKAAWLVSSDAAAAEDLVHEAFVKCAGRLSGIRDLTGFGRYWQQAVVRLAANQARDAGYRRRLLDRISGSVIDRESSDASVDRILTDAALRMLPYKQRAVLVARYYLDLSEAATADALGMRLGTVKSTTSRALATLRDAMQPESDR